MEDGRLKVFCAVAERLSFTQAAATLYLTQPAVTLQIKALERELGVRLFDRAGGRVQLTKAGSVLFDYAKRIAALYAEAERAVGEVIGEERGELPLAASTTIAQYLLPPLIGKFNAVYPGIEVKLLSDNTEGVIRALDQSRCKLGLIEGPVGRRDLHARRFVEDEIVCIVAADHQWANRPEVTPQCLLKEPLIMREHGSGTRRVIEAAMKRARLNLKRLRITMELDSTEAIKSAVEAGLGVGFVSKWALRKELLLGSLVALPISGMRMPRWFQFIYPHSPALRGAPFTFIRFAQRRRHELSTNLPTS